jgi:hypothetical protein
MSTSRRIAAILAAEVSASRSSWSAMKTMRWFGCPLPNLAQNGHGAMSDLSLLWMAPALQEIN